MIARRAFLGSVAAAALPAAEKLPNIVYILADDLGWGDLGCYNRESKIPTPNADRLAARGVRFTDMHSPSSVCTPTRYGILTGRYCWRSRLKQGVLVGDSPNLIEPGRLTVASMLKSRGYHTGAVGKWHLGLGDRPKTDYTQPLSPCPNDHGFDYFFGIPASLDFEPYVYVENNLAVEPPTSSTPGRNEPRGVFWRGGGMAPGFDFEQCLPKLTEKAVSFIRDRAAKPQPFFLYFPLTGPHTPWLPLAAWRGKSGAGIYGDFVAQVDDVLGQVARALEESGAANNTLLVFTSDNGAHWTPEDKAKYPHRANANWRGMKADIYDAGHRIPFLASWPGRIKPGTVSAQTGCLTDLMATLSSAVGFKLPNNAGEDSFDLLPAYLGKAKRPIREAIVHHSSMGLFSIRKGSWKLCLGRGSWGFSDPKRVEPGPGEPEGELYDLSVDPGEANNLYLSRQDKVAELTALLDRCKSDGFSRPMRG
jgi:arylsulfatase A-like enzyme